jgi:uncharacterized protein (TIGR02145 family)
MDDAHRCLQRQSGAQNWEAWIKDTRDNELYRIVKMPDNNWWLAQSVKYAGTGSSITVAGCTKETCGRWYTSTQANGGGSNSYGPNKQGVCPGAWTLPVAANWTALLNSIHTTAKTAAQYLACPQSNPTYSSWYGWSGSICVHRHDDPVTWDTYQSNDAVDYMVILWEDPANWVGANIGTIQPNCCPDSYRVRCFRQL